MSPGVARVAYFALAIVSGIIVGLYQSGDPDLLLLLGLIVGLLIPEEWIRHRFFPKERALPFVALATWATFAWGIPLLLTGSIFQERSPLGAGRGSAIQTGTGNGSASARAAPPASLSIGVLAVCARFA